MKTFLADYRFVLHWKWLLALFTLIVIGIACVFLALWQLGRYDRAEAHAELVNRNYHAAAVPLDALVAAPDAALRTTDQYRPVTVTGSYLPQDGVLARNRPLNSQSGFYVVVPFRTESGAVILVNRGWVASDSQGEVPTSVPAPPSGTVTLTGRLEMPEETLEGRTNPPGQVQSINVPVLAENEFAALAPLYTGVFLEMKAETPGVAANPAVLPMPSVDLGPHLGYAWQWYIFAAFFPLGWFVQARREAAARREEAGLSAAAPERPDAPVAALAGAAGVPGVSGVAPTAPSRRLRLRDHFSARNVAGEDEFVEDAIIDHEQRG